MKFPYRALGLLIISVLRPVADGSTGDRDEEYQQCLVSCQKVYKCPNAPKFDKVVSSPLKIPWHMQLLGWTCEAECRYECMHEIVAERRLHNMPIEQYYGKWPFTRFMGLQEPASVAFSILNGLAHISGYKWYRDAVIKKKVNHFIVPFVTGYMVICVHAWIWSAIYHGRDFIWTEKMDYFSAGAVLFFSLFLTLIRLLGWKERRLQAGLGLGVLILYLRHVYYLGWIHFDYGYNMIVMVSVGIVFNLLWFIWGLVNWNGSTSARMMVGWTVLATLAGGLELFDFVPVFGIFDAHSLWHAATIPLTIILYRIFALDVIECAKNLKLL